MKALRQNAIFNCPISPPVAVGLVLAFIPSAAHADSRCWRDAATGNLECLDPGTSSSFTVVGNIPAGEMPNPSVDGLSYRSYTWPDLNLLATGTIRTSEIFETPVFIMTGGNVRYDGSGQTIWSGGGSNTGLRIRAGDELEVWSGNIANLGTWASGAFIDAGRAILHGGNTVVGHGSTGLFVQSNYGDAIVFTGNIDAAQPESTGAVAFAKDWGDGYGCGTATVNVDGAVFGSAYGARAIGCANAQVTVIPGASLSTGVDGVAIKIEAGHLATVAVSGSVTAASPGAVAVDLGGIGSTLTIARGGSIIGRYYGTNGFDTFVIQSGGLWATGGENDFSSGWDSLRNGGTFAAGGDTRLLGLEKLENWGIIELDEASLSLPSGRLSNYGMITATGMTSINGRSIVNSGIISLSNGQAGDRLLMAGNVSNAPGSSVFLDVGPTGSDLLSITGRVSGQMTVNAFILPNTPQLLPPTLVVVAPTSAKGSTFALGSVAGDVSPLIAYDLVRNGDNYYLSSRLSAIAAAPASLVEIENARWYTMLRDQNMPLSSGPVGQLGFVRSNHDHDRRIDASLRFVDNEVTSGLVASDVRGADFHGTFTWDSGEDGWHGSATIAGLSYASRFHHNAFEGISRKPRTSVVGVSASIARRGGLGRSKIDWQAALSVRHTGSSRFSVDDVHYSMPALTRIEGSIGAKLQMPGRLDPVIEASINMVSGGAPFMAELEGQRFEIASRKSETWLHVGASIGQRLNDRMLINFGAELGDRTEGRLTANYRF